MRRGIAWIIGLLVVGALLFIAISYFFTSRQAVTLRYDTSLGATVELVAKASNSRATFSSGKTQSLVKGEYKIEVSGTNIDRQSIDLSIGDEPVDWKLDVSYSKSYLSNLLSKERSAIRASIVALYPNIDSFYTVKSGDRLILDGTWYIAKLRYTAPSSSGGEIVPNRDTLRLVMRKEQGKWLVVTKPPAIVVSKPDHPSVPDAVIDAANAPEVVDAPVRN